MTMTARMNRGKVLMLSSGEVGRRCVALLDHAPDLELHVHEPHAPVAELLAEPRDWRLAVLVSDRPCPAVAATLDELCWPARLPWLHAQLCGHQFRVGPAVIPHATPCWECLRRRLCSLAVDLPAHRAIEAAAAAESSEPWLDGQLAPLTEQVAALTVALCSSVYAGRCPPLADGMGCYWEGDALFGVLRRRRFARIGTCRRCAPRDADGSYASVAKHFDRRFVAKLA